MEAWAMILAFVVFVLAIYYYVFKDLSYFKKTGIPHVDPWPFLGNMASTVLRQRSMAQLTGDFYHAYPKAKYIGFFDMTNPVLMIRDPELVKTIAVKHFEHFPDHRGFVDEQQDPLFGKNLFSLRGDRWREARTMLSPAFTSSKLKGMYKLMNSCAADFADHLSKLPKERKTLEMKDAFTRYTNDVIATCAFGITINSMKDPDNDFYVLGKEGTSFGASQTIKFFMIRSFPTLSRLFDIKFISQRVVNFFTDIIRTTIETRDKQKIVRNDMIQLMMDARDKKADHGVEMELIEMVAQAFIFFFGGFDSVSTAMCFTCHEIGVNPDIQERLQQEIDRILDEHDGNPNYEVINNMEYLDAVISESLRMYPIAVFLDRLCSETFELPPAVPGAKPFVVKKDMNVWFPVYGFHHDPQYFDEPEKFNPDRFIENSKEIHNSGAYMPFGLGPRMCIGNRFALLEMKVLIFHLLARCNLKPCAKTSIPMKLSKKNINMTAENGFWIDLEERSDKHPSLQNLVSSNIANDVCKANGLNGHAFKT